MPGSQQQRQRQTQSLRQKSWLATQSLVLAQPLSSFGELLDDVVAKSYFIEKKPRAVQDGESWQGAIDALPDTRGASTADCIIDELVDLGLVSDEYVELARTISSDLDEDGFFPFSVQSYAVQHQQKTSTVRRILDALQTLTPGGIGARDRAQAFAVQLSRAIPAIPVDRLAALLRRRQSSISPGVVKSCLGLAGVPLHDEDLNTLMAVLDPRPVRRYCLDAARPVIPDIFVRRDPLTNELAAHVATPPYMLEIDISLPAMDALATEAKAAISAEQQRALWINDAVIRRTAALQLLADAFIRRLGPFLAGTADEPATMPIGTLMEETRLSRTVLVRALQRKYLCAPRGTFRLGQLVLNRWETKAHDAKKTIARLLLKDPQTVGMSDREIADVLRERGFHLSRRTVAKYRLALGIPAKYFRTS